MAAGGGGGSRDTRRWRSPRPAPPSKKKMPRATRTVGSRWTPMLGMDPATWRWIERMDTFKVDKGGHWRDDSGGRRARVKGAGQSPDREFLSTAGGFEIKVSIVVVVIAIAALAGVKWKHRHANRAAEAARAEDEESGAADIEEGRAPVVPDNDQPRRAALESRRDSASAERRNEAAHREGVARRFIEEGSAARIARVEALNRSRLLFDQDMERLEARVRGERDRRAAQARLAEDMRQTREEAIRAEHHVATLRELLEKQGQKSRAQELRVAESHSNGGSGAGPARSGLLLTPLMLKKVVRAIQSGGEGVVPALELKEDGDRVVETKLELLLSSLLAPNGAVPIEHVPLFRAHPDSISGGASTGVGEVSGAKVAGEGAESESQPEKHQNPVDGSDAAELGQVSGGGVEKKGKENVRPLQTQPHSVIDGPVAGVEKASGAGKAGDCVESVPSFETRQDFTSDSAAAGIREASGVGGGGGGVESVPPIETNQESIGVASVGVVREGVESVPPLHAHPVSIDGTVAAVGGAKGTGVAGGCVESVPSFKTGQDLIDDGAAAGIREASGVRVGGGGIGSVPPIETNQESIGVASVGVGEEGVESVPPLLAHPVSIGGTVAAVGGAESAGVAGDCVESVPPLETGQDLIDDGAAAGAGEAVGAGEDVESIGVGEVAGVGVGEKRVRPLETHQDSIVGGATVAVVQGTGPELPSNGIKSGSPLQARPDSMIGDAAATVGESAGAEAAGKLAGSASPLENLIDDSQVEVGAVAGVPRVGVESVSRLETHQGSIGGGAVPAMAEAVRTEESESGDENVPSLQKHPDSMIVDVVEAVGESAGAGVGRKEVEPTPAVETHPELTAGSTLAAVVLAAGGEETDSGVQGVRPLKARLDSIVGSAAAAGREVAGSGEATSAFEGAPPLKPPPGSIGGSAAAGAGAVKGPGTVKGGGAEVGAGAGMAVGAAAEDDLASRKRFVLDAPGDRSSKRASLDGRERGGVPKGTQHARGLAGAVKGLKPGILKELFVGNVVEAGGSPESVAVAQTILRRDKHCLEKQCILGGGKFGSVALVWDIASRREYALKTLKEGATIYAWFCAKVEMMVLARLALHPHENVVMAVALEDALPQMPIMLPKAECDLFEVITRSDWSVPEQLSLIVDVADGAQHLHSMGIIHRDIKSENVLVFCSNEHRTHAKLADYGFAREIGEECPGLMGTPGSIPPECLAGQAVVGHPSQDVFAVAALVLLIVVRADLKRQNMFAHEALYNADESQSNEMLKELSKTRDVTKERVGFELEVSKRTTVDGSVERVLLVEDMLDEDVKSREMVCTCLPFFLAPDPTVRQDLASLRTFTSNLAKEGES